MSNVLLGVALYPDRATSEAAVAIGQDFVGPTGSAPWCELVTEPYCLVYQAAFSSDAVPLVVEVVRDIAAEMTIVETTLDEFGIQDGHLSWITSRNDWRGLRSLQAKTIALAAHQRATQSIVVPCRQGSKDVLRDNLERYGYRYCGELFVPQVRLAYLVDLTSAMCSLDRLTPRPQGCRFERLRTVAMTPETGGIWTVSEEQLVA